MAGQGFGRIVNIGTNLFQNPVVPYHDYTAAKAALLSLTRTMSHDLGPDGITVNMISGGLLRSEERRVGKESGWGDDRDPRTQTKPGADGGTGARTAARTQTRA